MKSATVLSLLLAASCALAQDKPTITVSGDTKLTWNSIKGLLMKSADKMTEEDFAFKPTPEVRSYGQIIGHVADAQYMMCAAAKDEKRDPPGVEKSKTTKADLAAALKESIAYCDAVYDGMTDAKGAEVTKFFGRERTRLSILNFNISHSYEHYGNLVTYMRMKGLVPPSSEGRR